MIHNNLIPVILCGGNGARLWPLSRRQVPKQFLPILDGKSLFEDAIARAGTVCDMDKVVCVTNTAHRYLAKSFLTKLGIDADILVEPASKNTAVALSIAALWINQRYENATMLILPSDQLVENDWHWKRAIEKAVSSRLTQKWVSLGIEPNEPSTAYGYICAGQEVNSLQGVFNVSKFCEKPSAERACELFDQGWLWNSGISIVQADTLLKMVREHAPLIFSGCKTAMADARKEQQFILPDVSSFYDLPSTQIDKSVLEKSNDICVVPFSGYWRDVGSWDAMEKLAETTSCENRVTGEVVLEHAERTYVHSPHRLTIALGLKDVAIIDTQDVLLVANKANLDQLNEVVARLELDNRPELDDLPLVHKPWGHYDVKAQSKDYKVKSIVVQPGGVLSRQFHYHRAEHWIIIKGVATVICDGADQEFAVDECAFIPRGAIHRLENRTDEILELVEVQTGSYFGEDDIVRLEDEYGRI